MEGLLLRYALPIVELPNRNQNSYHTQSIHRLNISEEEVHRAGREERRYCDEEKYSSEKEVLAFLEQGLCVEKVVGLLNTCTNEKNPQHALALHIHIAAMGLETNNVVGNLLISVLVEVGLVQDAQRIFDSIAFTDQFSWNALITAYVQSGYFLKALILYDSMENHEYVHLSAYTFMALLKACTHLNDLERGQALHSEIASNGLLKYDAFYGSSLIRMYTKGGLLEKAQEVFDELQVRDTVVWNALITGYAEHGHGEEALSCFEKMQLERVIPSEVSFIGSLQGCGCMKALKRGQVLHSEIVKKGILEGDLAIGSSLLDMYGKCGFLVEARDVFDRLRVRDTISWSSLMAGYAEYGYTNEALDCFDQMQLEGVSLDALAWVCSLKACSYLGALEKGQNLHSQIIKEGLDAEISVGTSLVDMYVNCCLLERACQVFNTLLVQDVSAWNALISGYVEHGHGEDALKCFEQMQEEGVTADGVTFTCCLKACGGLKLTEKIIKIHEKLIRTGLEGECYVQNSLVDTYGKCGLIMKSQEAFEKVLVRDVISWNALISGYVEHGHAEEALNSAKRMLSEGISSDASTSVCCLKACGSIGASEKGQEIHSEVVKKGLERDPLLEGTLVYLYAKCGFLAEAQAVFDELLVRETVSWNALLNGYAQLGDSQSVFLTFDEMIESGEKPDLVSFLSVLHACTHAGLLDQALLYFESMSKDYGLTPALEHHTCMIDLHGRSGQLGKAFELIEGMPHHADVALWLNLLGACLKWGEVEVGTRAFQHSLQLDKTNATAYVHMCNIYTNAGMHEDAKRIALLRERMCMSK